MLARVIQAFEKHWLLFHAMNVFVAGVWLFRGYLIYLDYRERPSAGQILLMAMLGLLVVFYVFRRRSIDVATDLRSVLLAHLGTWLPFALGTECPPAVPVEFLPVCTYLMTFSLAVSLMGFVSLGRSWGILPANRGVQRHGLYRFIRHPIYASYIAFDIPFLLTFACPLNAALVVAIAVIHYSRARLEEKVLSRDPEYAEYMTKTRYMLLPWVI